MLRVTIELLQHGDEARRKRGRVTGFARTIRGPYDLLYCALRVLVGGRNLGASAPVPAVRCDGPTNETAGDVR